LRVAALNRPRSSGPPPALQGGETNEQSAFLIGAALGIGRFAAAAAESIARQPAAADKITGAVNLPLFLLEGVAILAEVFVLLIVLLK
jgi:F0F1-type ATP synthase membrane subunit c/vacuolar-type H+-ATPase subunit K